MLQMCPSCACCDRNLPPDASEAMICSFECTFCASCIDSVLGGVYPNCGGGFQKRPTRSAGLLTKYPASIERVVRTEACRRT